MIHEEEVYPESYTDYTEEQLHKAAHLLRWLLNDHRTQLRNVSEIVEALTKIKNELEYRDFLALFS